MNINLQQQKPLFLLTLMICISGLAYAQTTPPPPPTTTTTTPHVYPRITNAVGIVHPIVSFNSEGTTTNFDNGYTAGLAVGLNIWKSAKLGFSFEFVPFIHAEDGMSKMSNFLFHPGVLFPAGKGFTIVGRAAFETSGRYGVTPVFNKIVKKNKHSNYYVAVPVPVRFGNNRPNSIGAAFQFGLGF